MKIYGQSSLHLDYIIQIYQSEGLMVILQDYISNVTFIMVNDNDNLDLKCTCFPLQVSLSYETEFHEDGDKVLEFSESSRPSTVLLE